MKKQTISRQAMELAFVASCVESVAIRWNCSPNEVYERMKAVGMIEKYILPAYETLHTESREAVTDDMVSCLLEWEQQHE